MRKPLLLLACVASVTAAAGCGNACLSLAEQICSCQPDDTSRANCNQRAKEQEAIFAVRKQDEQFCQSKLDTNACACLALNTPEGRANCGIAYTSVPAAGAASSH